MPSSWKVLILCTGNSARSILAEYLLRVKGGGRFDVCSAGAKPTGRVNPLGLWVLQEHFGIDASDARSKSWDEFKGVPFDCVITVCDHARESCPIWTGTPIVAHWSSPDPAGVEGTDDEKKRAFVEVARQIARRVELLCALPPDQLNATRVQSIGREAKIAAMKPAPVWRVEPANAADAPAIRSLLAAADLPHEDIEPHLSTFLVAREGRAVIGAVGLEVGGTDALLRSLVVSPDQQNRGVAHRLVREIAALAQRRGVRRLFLLTTSAAAFFERIGFSRVERGAAPAAIAATRQFSGGCCATASCLSAQVNEIVGSR